MTPDIENKLKLARVAIDTNSEEAIKYSSEVLEADPDNAEAWFIKGNAIADIATGNDVLLRFRESMSYLDKAKETGYDPEKVEAMRTEVTESFASFCCQLGLQTWESAVSMASVRGSYRDAGDFPQTALNYYETALTIDPMFENALTSVIYIRKELGQVEMAQSHVERMKQLKPDYSPPWNRTGMNSNPDALLQVHQLLAAVGGLLLVILAILYIVKAR
jgi:tetratricopeptide (TPR) repeat protein